jgi:hypothetical protein
MSYLITDPYVANPSGNSLDCKVVLMVNTGKLSWTCLGATAEKLQADKFPRCREDEPSPTIYAQYVRPNDGALYDWRSFRDKGVRGWLEGEATFM